MYPALLLSLAVAQPVPGGKGETYGYLWPVCRNDPRRIAPGSEPVPYRPAEGDLAFYSARLPSYRLLYALARSGPPYHVAVVVRRCSGELALLEVGTDVATTTSFLPFPVRFGRHQREANAGVIWVRRVRRPLTPEESARLTRFAESQAGTRFAWMRAALLGTPFGGRGIAGRLPPRDRPHQRSWFCSEQVARALAVAGLIPETVRPSSVMPDELFYDTRVDLRCLWEPPRRWTCRPCPVPPEESPRDVGPRPCPACP